MKKRKTNLCKTCHKPFKPVNDIQKFCCRKCFKINYLQRLKIKRKKQQKLQRYIFPSWICPVCQTKSPLNIDPVRNPERLDTYRCPNCRIPNNIFWKYSRYPNSRQILQEFTFQLNAEAVNPTNDMLIEGFSQIEIFSSHTTTTTTKTCPQIQVLKENLFKTTT